MSDDYRALCLSHLVSVGIHHTLAFLAIPDDEVDMERDTLQPIGSCALYGPYMVAPVIEDEWDVVHASLDALWTRASRVPAANAGHARRRRIDARCARKSAGSLTIDVARERERHRENLGYVTATGACAFLVFVALPRASRSSRRCARTTKRPADTSLPSARRRPKTIRARRCRPEPLHRASDSRHSCNELRTALEREQLLIPQNTLLLTDQRTRKHPRSPHC